MIAAAASLWFRLLPGQKSLVLRICEDNVYLLLCVVFVVTGALWMVFDITYARYIRPLKRISDEAGMIYNANPSHRIQIKQGSRDLVRLANIINDFAEMFDNLNQTITRQIITARMETEKERNLLAGIMDELPQGILICNKNGRIILFNALAKILFFQDEPSTPAEEFLGLGRSVFHLIDKPFITHALEEITEQLNTPDTAVGSFFITPIKSGLLISTHVIPVLDVQKKFTGFILILEDASDNIRKYQVIDRQLTEFSTLLSTIIPRDEPAPIVDEFGLLGTKIRETFFATLPSTNITLASFLPSIQRKIGYFENIRVNMFNPFPETRFLADTYSMTQAFVFIFRQMAAFTSVTEFDLRVHQHHQVIQFSISWEGPPCADHRIQTMIRSHLNGLPSLGYVLKFNNAKLSQISTDDRQCKGLLVTARAGAQKMTVRHTAAPMVFNARPEFYDFDLFSSEDVKSDILNIPLKELSYTVFDTETTGLRPDGGDEIVSIGAVRIINLRIAYQDVFEELVNPCRDIPLASYKIHGISYEMVKAKPPITEVLPRFKTYSENTVLVGHNLAFDLKMFKLKEKATGIRFPHSVLDTLLLSAVLHPAHENHDLENIAERLGVDILGRHTALGDAITTAEIFLKLIPILNANGILTLKDALNVSKRSYYARLKY